jgi:hypothetical protein
MEKKVLIVHQSPSLWGVAERKNKVEKKFCKKI